MFVPVRGDYVLLIWSEQHGVERRDVTEDKTPVGWISVRGVGVLGGRLFLGFEFRLGEGGVDEWVTGTEEGSNNM